MNSTHNLKKKLVASAVGVAAAAVAPAVLFLGAGNAQALDNRTGGTGPIQVSYDGIVKLFENDCGAVDVSLVDGQI